MNGRPSRYLLDTNAVVALLQGHTGDVDCFQAFEQRVDVIGLTRYAVAYLKAIVRMRQQYRLKLPDAIIAATALEYSATLVTADRQLQIGNFCKSLMCCIGYSETSHC